MTDLSSLTETQIQQIQQLHQQFQEHQIQKQKEQQQLAAAASYNPSHHFQSYNQSYYPYSHYPQQQHYPYYDYSNVYYHQHEPYSPIQPPGVSYEEAAAAAADSQHAYYPHYTQPLDNPSAASSDYRGLNPAATAAVEALSQLTQFATQRAMGSVLQDRQQWNPNNELGGGGMYSPMPMPLHHGAGRSSHERNGVKGGGRTFRGCNRGNSRNRLSRPDGSAPSRGRGGGGGRRFPSHCDSLSPFPEASAQKSKSASAHVEVAQSGKTGTDEPPQTTPAPALSTAATTTTSVQAIKSTRRPPGISWCELCRVDCTTPDVLELHKNGKKHKKNLLRFEVMQNSGNHTSNPTPSRDLPRIQTEKITMGEEATVHPENTHRIEQPALNDLATETTTADEQIMDSEEQNKVLEMAEVLKVEENEATTEGQRVDQFDTRKRGLKRKLRGGQVDKCMKMAEHQITRVREEVSPVICDLCNVKCDTQVVLDIHMAGKKHLSKMRRMNLSSCQVGKCMKMAEHQISRVREPPKEVKPVICHLCNVKCDTQAVLDIHMGGKKHLSKISRFQGHQAMHAPVGLQMQLQK